MGKQGVIVVGGGIGGLAAALSIGNQGFDVTVLERSPAFVEIGAGLQLAPNATRVLKGLDLLDRVIDVGVLPSRIVLASATTGDELTSLVLDDFDENYGGPYVVVHRSDLLSILYEACLENPRVELIPGKTLVEVDQSDPDRSRAICADGSSYEGSVIVGADGLHSVVRTLLTDDQPIFSGYVAYRGALPRESTSRPIESNDVVAFVGPGMHFVQYPLRRGEIYNQVAVFRSNRYFSGEDEWGTPDEMDESFTPACSHVREALQSIQRHVHWPMYDRLPLDNWTTGRAVLLGDAAHPMLQYLAQGACQALVDGACLGSMLGDASRAGTDLPVALLEYQRARIPPTAKVQRHARLWGDLWHADGLLASLRDVYLRERDPRDQRHIEPIYSDTKTATIDMDTKGIR